MHNTEQRDQKGTYRKMKCGGSFNTVLVWVGNNTSIGNVTMLHTTNVTNVTLLISYAWKMLFGESTNPEPLWLEN